MTLAGGALIDGPNIADDDTIVTYMGNFIFTIIGKLFFSLKITDILYTFVIGDTTKVKNLNLKSKDFVLCVELPIISKKNNLKVGTSKSNERARIGGKKKVNALKDGYLIFSLPSSKGFLYNISYFFYKIGFKSFYNRLWQKDLSSPHITYFNQTNLNLFLKKFKYDLVYSEELDLNEEVNGEIEIEI